MCHRHVHGPLSSYLAVPRLGLDVLRNLDLPLVPIVEQLLLVVQKLLARFRRELRVWPLHDRVDRARLLAEAAVNALRHIDIVPRRAARAVLALLSLDRDRLSRAHGLAELASNAALLTRGVTAENVFAAEPRGNGGLLKGVIDRDLDRAGQEEDEGSEREEGETRGRGLWPAIGVGGGWGEGGRQNTITKTI